MWYLYIFILFFSFILTYFVRKFALKKSIIDMPNERSSHKTPTPRGGGISIVLTYIGGLVYLYYLNKIETNLFLALLSGCVIAVVSLLDDIMDLKPSIRIIAQLISSIGALFFLGGIKIDIIGNNLYLFWFINIITLLGIVWFINLYNFLDGIDAYASQEAIMVSLGIYLLTWNPICIILIAAVSGFLIWNWPKAKIFMGDVGSTQLGFILVVLAIYFNNKSEIGIISWIVLTSIFWFDASYTLLRRYLNKEKLSIAHKKHAYQRLNQSGFSHLKINILAIGLNILLIGIVCLNFYFFNLDIVILILSIGMMSGIICWIDKLFPFAKNNNRTY
jgi:UDP-N-acetylmuramyl pentapeptide phosphotransferase/UDP-N-acetylglucosamine-1-phosphate transferase